MTLAEIAVELRLTLSDVEFRECCLAYELEAMAAGANRSKLMIIAAEIGLSPSSTRDVLDTYEKRASALKIMHNSMVAALAINDRANAA